MRDVIALVLAFLVGLGCARFKLAVPAPNSLFGVAMILAITLGYLLGMRLIK